MWVAIALVGLAVLVHLTAVLRKLNYNFARWATEDLRLRQQAVEREREREERARKAYQ